MSDPEQLDERLSSTGHHYHGVHIGPGAKAQVGDIYNIGQCLNATEKHNNPNTS